MKKLIFILFIAVMIASCSPVAQLEPTPLPENAVTSLPTKTQLPSPTFTPTLIPTPTLSPDPNIYECAESVAKEDCDSVKDYVHLTRYYLVNNLGGDISTGVKIIVENIPSSKQANGFSWKKGEVPFIYINTGETIWVQAKNSGFEWQNKALIGHEFTHFWQYDHGCMVYYENEPRQYIMLEGMATWVGEGVTPDTSRSDYGYGDERALFWWHEAKYDWRKWFQSDQMPTLAVKHLVDSNSVMALRTFCDVAKESKNFDQAFETAFGLSFDDFRIQFMEEVLGKLKDCTVVTCGVGVDHNDDIWKLKHFLDPSKTTPNLVANFVDQNNQPINLTHVSLLLEDADNGGIGGYSQPFTVTGTFSEAVFPGRYHFWFCEVGYPTEQFSGSCTGYETDWFEVSSDAVTNITFKIPPHIELTDATESNLAVTIKDEKGDPIPDLRIQICNYDTSVKVCSPASPGKYTDSHGIFYASLRSGKYLIRLEMKSGNHDPRGFSPFYQVRDINIFEDNITTISYQLPAHNLVVKFLDVNGSPVPYHAFGLSIPADKMNLDSIPTSLWEGLASTDKNGVFEAFVEPGEYHIFTCKLDDCFPFDYKISVLVESETEVTTVEFSLYK